MQKLNLLLATLFMVFLNQGCSMRENKVERHPYTIDHIILGINDLDRGIAQFERMTGVKPVKGGEHPDRFSQNALVQLGPFTYLEIMAPKPGADSIPHWIKNMDSLTLAGWAIGVTNAQATKQKLKEAGIETTELMPGSRRTMDGNLLAWKTFEIVGLNSAVHPFFIEWAQHAEHPASGAPAGCTYSKLSVLSKDSVLNRLVLLLELPVAAFQSADSTETMGVDILTSNFPVYFKN